MIRRFVHVGAFEDTVVEIDGRRVTERHTAARPDAPGVAVGERSFEIKPGHVDAYIDECLLAHGYREESASLDYEGGTR